MKISPHHPFKAYFLVIVPFSFLFFHFVASGFPLDQLKLPPNFVITPYALIPKARQMALGDDGVVFIGTLGDKVYALLPDTNQNAAKKVVEVASGLDRPNGVAFRNEALYVAETSRVLKYNKIIPALKKGIKVSPEIFFNSLPKDHYHGDRYIKFGPDGWLYVGIGIPCNICLKEDPIFGTISRISEDGKKFEIYAKGVRNSMGFAWHPTTKALWFTDNGRDLLGDNEPPDELNNAATKGLHFGFPFFNAYKPDPEFIKYKIPNLLYTPPVLALGPHVASLGMIFYNGKMFPSQYQNQIFIAEHGSWNRSAKIGYRISLVTLKENHAISYQPFVTGWLQGQNTLGRPVDLLVVPDGSLLISDDYAGMIYRITYLK